MVVTQAFAEAFMFECLVRLYSAAWRHGWRSLNEAPLDVSNHEGGTYVGLSVSCTAKQKSELGSSRSQTVAGHRVPKRWAASTNSLKPVERYIGSSIIVYPTHGTSLYIVVVQTFPHRTDRDISCSSDHD